MHQRKDIRRAHLLQSSNDRWRLPQAPGNMAPLPYMLVPGAQGGAPFPGQQRQYFNEYPRGGPSPRGLTTLIFIHV